jgi:hypothetical protein
LNLQTTEREKLIGDYTNALMKSLPADAPKGYLLQPKSALTLQGLIDQVLEADGITPEMMDRERRKVEVINQLAQANKEEREQILADNQDLIDLTFFELLMAASQSASQSGDERASLRLLNIRQHLMDTTEIGETIKEQQAALMEASQELQALGERVTRESFVDLIVNAAHNPAKVEALGMLGRALLDYTTFQLITQRIESAAGDEKSALEWARDRLLQINAEYEQQARAMIQRAADTLRMLLQSGDIPAAIMNSLDRIDDTFLQVLQVNLEEARRAGNTEVSERLRQVRDEVLQLIQASAPPEIRLINDLLALESEEESLAMLRDRQNEITEDLLNVMDDLSEQLRTGGNGPAADRLDVIRAEAENLVS